LCGALRRVQRHLEPRGRIPGVWQFTDPTDPHGERGKEVKGGVPWRQALALPGSTQMLPAKKLLATLNWWKLAPQRDQLRVDGQPNPLPTTTDLSPPHLAVIAGQAMVAYLPRGNANRELTLPLPPEGSFCARWFDPRRGEFVGDALSVPGTKLWTLPGRPAPADEDWVLVVTAQ
jgi:hypothetical protein